MSPDLERRIERGLASLRAGDVAGAERCFRGVLDEQPRNPGALHMLGLIAHRRGDRGRAIEALRAAAHADPGNGEIHTHLAEVLRVGGDAAGAVEAGREAVRLDPGSAPAHNNLGLALQDQGALEAAAAAFGAALAADGRYAKACYNLGNVLRRLGRLEEAEASLRRALELQPRYPQAWNALGVILAQRRRTAEACRAFRRALELAPRYAKALYNVGNVLADDRPAEALKCYDQALSLRPEYREALLAKGSLLTRLQRYREGIATLGRAARIGPGDPRIHLALGGAHFARFDFTAAAAAYRRALELDPGLAEARGNLELCRAEVCDWQGRREAVEELRKWIAAHLERGEASPLSAHGSIFFPLSPAERLAIARQMAVGVARRVEPVARELAFTHPGQTPARLRLGYLSSDFRDNALAHLTLRLYGLHDRERFEVFGYSLGPDDGSSYRRDIAAGCDRFVDLRPASDAEAARRIHADGIHILIDLTGFAGGGRPGIPALRPAPVQAVWLYPGTLGGVFHDYLVGDPVVTPPERMEDFGERLVVLPHCYQVNDHLQPLPERPGGRDGAGLPQEGFVFSCFNTHAKIEPEIFGVWMRLLAGVPGSVLWLLDLSAGGRENLRREAAAGGVDPERLLFAPHVRRADHLSRLTLADLALDTRVCSGHTTTSDALWAGVPVVACPGDSFPSRVSASLLRALGLPELIAGSLDAYEKLALHLIRSPGELGVLRRELGRRRRNEPLFDTPRFVRNLERAYGAMWERRGEDARDPILVEETGPTTQP